MSMSAEPVNRSLQRYQAYLETLTFIQIDPRLRGKVGWSDIIQKTVIEAWQSMEQIEEMASQDQKRWLRRMLLNNLKDEIAHWRAQQRDVRLEQSIENAVSESSSRVQSWLAVEDSSPSGHAVHREEGLKLLEALSRLDVRQREALILQKYHGWTLSKIADHLGCTTGAVAGLHARGLKELRRLLPDME